MLGILSAIVGSITDIKVPEAKEGKPAAKPFFVISGRDLDVFGENNSQDPWVAVFVKGDSVESLQKLHDTIKVGHYITVNGRASSSVNFYEGKVGARSSLNTTPGGVKLMGAPITGGSDTHPDNAPTADAEPAGATAAAGAPTGNASIDEIGF